MKLIPQGSDLLDRPLPHDLEAERGVLGSLMIDSRLCDDVAAVLEAKEFYSTRYRTIFAAINEIHQRGQRVDVILLLNVLRGRRELEGIGGATALEEILSHVPVASNAVWFAEKVRDCAIRREAITAAIETLSEAHEPCDPREMLRRNGTRFAAVEERRVRSQAIEMEAAMSEALAVIDERRTGSNPGGIETPWSDLNHKIGCLRNGELCVLAARPGMGKTAIAMDITAYIAETLGEWALFVSLEMSRQELCERLLSARADIRGEYIRDGRLTDIEVPKLIEAASGVSAMRLAIDDTPDRTMLDIVCQARALARQGKLRILVVDHLGLIAPDNPREPRQEQVAKVARKLKVLAKELKIPVLALAQLNREAEKRSDHRPKLSDLRESGAIEQDAGIVMFVHREEEYRPNDPDLVGKAELIVAKNRGGQKGIVYLQWNAATTTFTEASREFEFD